MGRKCSVENCTSDSTKPEHTGVTFHKVPHHPDVRPKWLSLCRIPEDKSNHKVLYVCSRHFLRVDFCSFKGKKYMLRHGVLPSVFPWDKSKLEAIKAEATIRRDLVVPKKKTKPKVPKKNTVTTVHTVASDSEAVNQDETACEETLKEIPKTEVKVEPPEIKNEPTEPISTSELQIDIKNEVKEEVSQDIDVFDQHQRSQDSSSGTTPLTFAINSKIEVLDHNNIWYPAKINEVDYEESEILIHFEKFSCKYDEWISMSSPRLRPLQLPTAEKYEEGERCMAIWSDSRKFPATVSKVLENDTYEVLFDDGFVKVLKNHKMSKMHTARPAQSSPLFEPVKGTKQERRDKKRKLNVAALFGKGKRARVSHGEDKKPKGSPTVQNSTVLSADECLPSPVPQDEASSVPTVPATPVTDPQPITQWHPTWLNGKPVGTESSIEGIDGFRKSIIVADPRLPPGWVKHLSQRTYGHSAGKWDTIIVGPENKKFRMKHEIKNYLDLNPHLDVSLDVFDFSIYRNRHKKKHTKAKKLFTEKKTPVPKAPPVPKPAPVPKVESVEPQPETTVEKPTEVETAQEESVTESPPVSLKVIFENDSYKCPIEGCGKNFRRENLALMHVKHYHSEYTKYLDSTPNVADLAYARTVGENLDRSPGPGKASSAKTSGDKTPVSRVSKFDPKTPVDSSPLSDNKGKDSEIIKLLNQKPIDSKDIQPLPPGLPTSMYPDIKLKDLLGKDDVPMRDDINIKTLCASRPSQGIKTLLPVRLPVTPSNVRQQPVTAEASEEKVSSKRKKHSTESAEALKGKTSLQPPPLPSEPPQSIQLHQPPTQQPPTQSQPLSTSTQPTQHVQGASHETPRPSAFDATPSSDQETASVTPAAAQFDGVIIEGGKIIKLERMKQEEIINCTCGFPEEDGLMIQCELCLCWQHAYCNNIQKESEVPEKYVCYICEHPEKERRSARYLHDQDWLKQGVLPVASFHTKDSEELKNRFEKLKKCHDLSGGLLELREYLHTLALKLKIAEAKNHPKLYLWSKPWDKPRLPEKSDIKEEEPADVKPKVENSDHEYVKNELEDEKQEPQSDSMLMMILKGGKEDMPMLNMHNNIAPIIPRPEAAIDSDDCRLNLLDHISHSESLIEERLDDFEKQLDTLEEGLNLETDENYPRTRQTMQMLMRDLDTLKRFSELPMV